MTLGILAFVVLLCGAIWHILQSRFWVACTGAGLTTAVILLFLSFIAMGYLDPFFIVTAAINFTLGFVGAMLIGCIVRFVRGLRSKS